MPGNSAGRRPGAPPWVGAGESPSLVTRVTDPLRETTQKAATSLQANDGSSFLALQEPRTLSRLVEQSLRLPPPPAPQQLHSESSLHPPFAIHQQSTQQISVQHILCFRECSRSGGFRVQQDEACWSLAPSASQELSLSRRKPLIN